MSYLNRKFFFLAGGEASKQSSLSKLLMLRLCSKLVCRLGGGGMVERSGVQTCVPRPELSRCVECSIAEVRAGTGAEAEVADVRAGADVAAAVLRAPGVPAAGWDEPSSASVARTYLA